MTDLIFRRFSEWTLWLRAKNSGAAGVQSNAERPRSIRGAAPARSKNNGAAGVRSSAEKLRGMLRGLDRSENNGAAVAKSNAEKATSHAWSGR